MSVYHRGCRMSKQLREVGIGNTRFEPHRLRTCGGIRSSAVGESARVSVAPFHRLLPSRLSPPFPAVVSEQRAGRVFVCEHSAQNERTDCRKVDRRGGPVRAVLCSVSTRQPASHHTSFASIRGFADAQVSRTACRNRRKAGETTSRIVVYLGVDQDLSSATLRRGLLHALERIRQHATELLRPTSRRYTPRSGRTGESRTTTCPGCPLERLAAGPARSARGFPKAVVNGFRMQRYAVSVPGVTRSAADASNSRTKSATVNRAFFGCAVGSLSNSEKRRTLRPCCSFRGLEKPAYRRARRTHVGGERVEPDHRGGLGVGGCSSSSYPNAPGRKSTPRLSPTLLVRRSCTSSSAS